MFIWGDWSGQKAESARPLEEDSAQFRLRATADLEAPTGGVVGDTIAHALLVTFEAFLG